MATKAKFCTNCGGLLEDDGRCVSCPAGSRRAANAKDRTAKPGHVGPDARRACGWNDFGHTCQAEALHDGRCRQHAGMRGYIGNQPPAESPAMGVWREAMLLYKRGGGKGEYPVAPNVPDMSYSTRQWHLEMAEYRKRGGKSILYDEKKPDLPPLDTLIEAAQREPGEDREEAA